MKISPKARISLIWLGWILIWALILVLTKIELFPCQTFVHDSKQGFYNSLCPVINEDAQLVLFQDTKRYDFRPYWITWIITPIVVLGIPAMLTAITWLIYHRVSLRPKA